VIRVIREVDEQERAPCLAEAKAMYAEHFAGRSATHALNVLASLMLKLIELYPVEDRAVVTAMLVRGLENAQEH
jgi:hypothetical protein